MKYQNKILSVLKEAQGESLTNRIQQSSDAIKSAYQTTVQSMKNLTGVGDDEAEDLATAAISSAVKTEGVSNSSHVVQYDSERSGEEPFMLNGVKWQFVNVINNDGKKDIGVYRFDHDLAYDYQWFMDEVVPKPKNDEMVTEVGDEKVHTAKFDRCVADVEKQGDVDNPYAVCQASLGSGAIKKSHRDKPEDEYVRTQHEQKEPQTPEDAESGSEEYENFLDTIKKSMDEHPPAGIENIVGKVKKEELERIMESIKPKKKIIKVKELKK